MAREIFCVIKSLANRLFVVPVPVYIYNSNTYDASVITDFAKKKAPKGLLPRFVESLAIKVELSLTDAVISRHRSYIYGIVSEQGIERTVVLATDLDTKVQDFLLYIVGHITYIDTYKMNEPLLFVRDMYSSAFFKLHLLLLKIHRYYLYSFLCAVGNGYSVACAFSIL